MPKMQKMKVRFEVPIESGDPYEAVKQGLAYLKVADEIEADVFGYMGPIRVFLQRIRLKFIKENPGEQGQKDG